MNRGVSGLLRLGRIERVVARFVSKSDVKNGQRLEEGNVTTA